MSKAHPLDITDIVVEEGPSLEDTESDLLIGFETRTLDEAERRAALRGMIQDISERKAYANKVFCLVCVTLAAVFGLAFLNGTRIRFRLGALDYPWPLSFELSDTVMVALISGATVNVIALFAIVMTNLFPRLPRAKGAAKE